MRSSDWRTGDALDDVAALVAERNRIDALLARRVRAAELSQAPERDGLRPGAAGRAGPARRGGAGRGGRAAARARRRRPTGGGRWAPGGAGTAGCRGPRRRGW